MVKLFFAMVALTAATLPAVAQSFLPPLDVNFRVQASRWPKPKVSGSTSLPDGIDLILTLTGPKDHCAPDCLRQASSKVVHGRFEFGPFDMPRGTYDLLIGSAAVELQSPEIQAVIGAHGENLRGPHVRLLAGSNAVNFSGRVTVE
jgi:hypothetical protein